MDSVMFTVHLTDDENPLYALMPSDGCNGYLIGDLREVRNLRDALNRVIEGQHDGVISHLDERLGWQWLTVRGAAEAFNVPPRTVLYAARHGHIQDAKKERGRWKFPQARFLAWLNRRPKRGPKPNVLR